MKYLCLVYAEECRLDDIDDAQHRGAAGAAACRATEIKSFQSLSI